MRKYTVISFSRTLAALAVGIGFVGIGACSGGATGSESTPSSEPVTSLKGFDPCVFFKPNELTAAGVSTEQENFSPTESQPGCKWDGELLTISLQKDAGQTLADYRQGSFDVNELIDINGRKAARVVSAGSVGQGVCNIVLSAGGGIVILKVTGAMRDSIPEPCGKAQEIATKIEPRLPG